MKSPDEAMCGGFNLDRVRATIKKIDSCLIPQNRSGTSENYQWRCVVEGELSHAEREYIKDAYLEAGWDDVTSQTSSEKGERPGLTGFTLTTCQV